MAHACVGVSEISGSCGNLNLMVRVVRLWTTPSFNNACVPGSIEMVLMDKDGDKIHCSVRRHLVSRFLNVLVEGRCYKICSLAFVPNVGSYRTTRHDSRVVFHLKTTVSPVELPYVDMYGICPTSFADVLNETLNSDYLIDVVGLLTGLSQPKEYEREGKMSRMSVVELTSENLKLECALFGEYVDQMQSYVGSGDLELPIVVLQSVKIKSFRGKIGLQNVMFATRILFNPDIKEVTEFRNSIALEGGCVEPSVNIYKETHVSIEDDFMKSTPRSTIENLTSSNEGGSFVILGTIKSVVEDEPWWYTACRCGRSVVADVGMYFCDVCEHHIFSVSPRFKVKLEVEDETGSGIFVLFERECSSLLRKTCAELFLESMKDPESVRASAYPSLFNELWGRKLLFKIETKVVSPYRYHGTFRVKRICDDDTIISMFSLNGAECTPTKAIFTPGLSIGGIETVSLGSGSGIRLGDDHDNGSLNCTGGSVDNITGVVYGQVLHHKKSVSRLGGSGSCTVGGVRADGNIGANDGAVTPAKRSLEEEFEEVADSPRNEKLKAKKVVDE